MTTVVYEILLIDPSQMMENTFSFNLEALFGLFGHVEKWLD